MIWLCPRKILQIHIYDQMIIYICSKAQRDVCEVGNVTWHVVVVARVSDGVQERNSRNKPDSGVEQQEAAEGKAVEYYFASDARSVELAKCK